MGSVCWKCPLLWSPAFSGLKITELRYMCGGPSVLPPPTVVVVVVVVAVATEEEEELEEMLPPAGASWLCAGSGPRPGRL